MVQQLIVAGIVALAFGYTVWSLMPAAWRGVLRRRLGRSAAAASSCGGCDGCAGKPAAGVAPDQPVQVRFFPVRLASYKASSARSRASSIDSPER